MRKFHLYGVLAERVGEDVVNLDVNNLAQFITYLEQFDLRRTLIENNWYVGIGKDVDNLSFITTAEGLLIDLDDNDVWIAPDVDGEGAIFAVVGALFTGTLFGGGVLGTILGNLFSSLLFYGISMLLSPTPKAPQQTAAPAKEEPSFLFNGAVNITEQGGAVPVVYGRARCGSVVISSSVRSEQLL